MPKEAHTLKKSLVAIETWSQLNKYEPVYVRSGYTKTFPVN